MFNVKDDDIDSDYERIDTDNDGGLMEISKSRDKINIEKSKISKVGGGLHKFLDMRHILGFLN